MRRRTRSQDGWFLYNFVTFWRFAKPVKQSPIVVKGCSADVSKDKPNKHKLTNVLLKTRLRLCTHQYVTYTLICRYKLENVKSHQHWDTRTHETTEHSTQISNTRAHTNWVYSILTVCVKTISRFHGTMPPALPTSKPTLTTRQPRSHWRDVLCYVTNVSPAVLPQQPSTHAHGCWGGGGLSLLF